MFLFSPGRMHTRPPITKSPLGLWIAETLPGLEAELNPLPLNKARVLLNEITGLSIPETSSIRETVGIFLERLKEMHANGELAERFSQVPAGHD